MMHMEHRLQQTQTQRLMLTQKMQQAIQILQLSGMELEQYIQQELETNPVLEQVVPKKDDERSSKETANDDGPASDFSAQFDDGSFDLDSYANALSDYHREGTDFSRNGDFAERQKYYEDSITKEDSLPAHLMNQLAVSVSTDEEMAIGERILGEVDSRGYFTGSLEEIAEELGKPLHQVERMLYRMQRFEPTGVCARDVVECLLLQIAAEFPNEPQLRELVENHLDLLEKRQIPKIAKAMGVTPGRVEQLKGLLASLNPWPGNEFTSVPTQYIMADVTVEKDEDDNLIVYLTEEASPQLGINEHYKRMVKKDGIAKDEKRYLREKVESARWLIRNIEQRKQTILRIAHAIVDVQRDFMQKGQQFLRPLTLQEIADVVGVHEATVSRTTRGKYMQTPQGLFEMKYFFSPGLKKDGGDSESSKAVMSMIQELVDGESKAKPLSDQKLSDLLKERGINVARRTVTKYREALGIPSTTLRRSYEKSGK